MGALISLLGGPLVGLFGSAVSAFFKGQEAKQALEAKRIDQAHELALLARQAEARAAETENERAIATVDAVSRQVTASYQADAAAVPGHAWAADLKALARPFFTLLLIVLSGAVYFTFDPLDGINPIQEHIVGSILFLTEVAVAWWFGDRARASSRG